MCVFLCRYESYNLSAPIKTNLHFSLSQSGVLNFEKAETVVEVTEWYEVPVTNSTSNETTADKKKVPDEVSANIETDDAAPNEEGITEGPAVDGSGDGPSGADESTATEPLVQRKLRKRTIRIPLKVRRTIPSSSMPRELSSSV